MSNTHTHTHTQTEANLRSFSLRSQLLTKENEGGLSVLLSVSLSNFHLFFSTICGPEIEGRAATPHTHTHTHTHIHTHAGGADDVKQVLPKDDPLVDH